MGLFVAVFGIDQYAFMINIKFKIFLVFLVLTSIFLVFRYYYLGNPRLIITNTDDVSVDSIHVQLTGNSYFISEIDPRETKTIRLNPLSDSDVAIFTQNREYEIIIGINLDRASTGGFIKAEITSDSLVSFEHKSGIL